MDSFTLSRNWFNFCFENPEKICPNHTALYFFAIEHCNRLGNKEKFGLPTEMAKEAIGIKSWHTYIKAFNDLVEWKFFILIEKSKNQFSSNIIALSKNNKALNKALDKATTKHASKQLQSTHQSNDSIIKQINKETIEQIIYNDFYDSELISSKEHKDFLVYEKFVKFLFGENEINKKLSNVLSISTQVSFNEYLKLRALASKSNKSINDTVLSLENKKGSATKYSNLYLTLNKWLKNNF